MFIAVYGNRNRLPWLIGLSAAMLLLGVGVLVS